MSTRQTAKYARLFNRQKCFCNYTFILAVPRTDYNIVLKSIKMELIIELNNTFYVIGNKHFVKHNNTESISYFLSKIIFLYEIL